MDAAILDRNTPVQCLGVVKAGLCKLHQYYQDCQYTCSQYLLVSSDSQAVSRLDLSNLRVECMHQFTDIETREVCVGRYLTEQC